MVFYSAKSPGELRELANKQGVDGVYFASREDGGLVEATYTEFRTIKSTGENPIILGELFLDAL
jgi:hypothetical protein